MNILHHLNNHAQLLQNRSTRYYPNNSNYGEIQGGTDYKIQIGAMLNALTNGNILSAKKLGDIAVGYKLQTGKEWVENKKGCLLPLALIFGVLTAVGSALASVI